MYREPPRPIASSLAKSPLRNSRSRVVLIVVYASPRDGSSSAATCRAEAFPSLPTDPMTAASRSPSSMIDRNSCAALEYLAFYRSRNLLSTLEMDSQGPESSEILQGLTLNLYLNLVVWRTQMLAHGSRLHVSHHVSEFMR